MEKEGWPWVNGKTTKQGCAFQWKTGLLVASFLLAMEGASLAVDKGTSLMPDLSSPEAGRTERSGDRGVVVRQALQDQSQRIDRQIADFEARFITPKHDHRHLRSLTDTESIQRSAPQVAQGEGSNIAKEDVQTLEETVVTDTYLDPFEEPGKEETVEDPWEAMNTRMFSFNMKADRYVLKPLATGYAWILPDPVERAIGRAINNIRFVPRTMNNLFQQKWNGASRETGRFLINSTVGIGGLFDVAESQFGMKPATSEDFGQTLAMYGIRSGPYLVLPLLPPTTVRDGAGMVGDMLMDPLSYFIPFFPQTSVRTTEIVNDRSQNLELYDGVETSTVDLYGAVRSGYMQRRSQAIQE